MKKYEYFCKALSNLQEGLALEEPYNIVEQTGIARLFVICYEQSWTLMKALLESRGQLGASIGSPRVIIKVACRCGMINDESLWLKLLEARNTLSDAYSDEQALGVIRAVKAKYIHAFEALKVGVEEQWLEG